MPTRRSWHYHLQEEGLWRDSTATIGIFTSKKSALLAAQAHLDYTDNQRARVRLDCWNDLELIDSTIYGVGGEDPFSVGVLRSRASKYATQDGRSTPGALKIRGAAAITSALDIGGHLTSRQPAGTTTFAGAAGAPTPTWWKSGANDMAGTVTFGSRAPANGVVVTVTFVTAYLKEPTVVVSAANAATAALDLFVSVQKTGFSILARNATAANASIETYLAAYVIVG